MIDSASHQTSSISVTIQTAALRIYVTKPYRCSYIQIDIPITLVMQPGPKNNHTNLSTQITQHPAYK